VANSVYNNIAEASKYIKTHRPNTTIRNNSMSDKDLLKALKDKFGTTKKIPPTGEKVGVNETLEEVMDRFKLSRSDLVNLVD
jgi:hypothetical protein